MSLAGETESPQSAAALAQLCQTYWYPLYVFVRQQGQSREDAQDLVQGFFAELLAKNYLKRADRQKGRFRSFLLTALKRHMANQWDHARRLKRGGGEPTFSIDEETANTRYQAGLVDPLSPEKAFDREWARALLGQVLGRLEAEFSGENKAPLFAALKVFVCGDAQGVTHAEIGQRLGMSEGAVKVAVHRLRRRYRELLRALIAETVDGPEAVDEEIRDLFLILQ